MIRAKINGIDGEFAYGITILVAAQSIGLDIPTLCNDERLDPVGACRMCLVEVKGRAHEAVSCTTELTDAMEVETHSDPIESARKWNLRMLAGKYPTDAFTAYPDKPFHKLAADHGLTADDFHGEHSIATKEVVSDEFPFMLTTGRVLKQFNAGTMTMRTPNREMRPTDLLMISKDDSKRLSIAAGETVRLKSNYGEAVLPVEITDRVKSGELFASLHDPAVFLNYATGPTRDRFTQAPEFKVTAVRIEKLNGQSPSN